MTIKAQSIKAIASRLKVTAAGAADFKKLFDQLVPKEGPCKTLEGELLRAAGKIWYRCYNDGDVFTDGYGCETAGPAATFILLNGGPKLAAVIKAGSVIGDNPRNEKKYQAWVNGLKAAVAEYVTAKAGKYTPNKLDMLRTKSKWTQPSRDEYEDDDNY